MRISIGHCFSLRKTSAASDPGVRGQRAKAAPFAPACALQHAVPINRLVPVVRDNTRRPHHGRHAHWSATAFHRTTAALVSAYAATPLRHNRGLVSRVTRAGRGTAGWEHTRTGRAALCTGRAPCCRRAGRSRGQAARARRTCRRRARPVFQVLALAARGTGHRAHLPAAARPRLRGHPCPAPSPARGSYYVRPRPFCRGSMVPQVLLPSL